MDEEDDASAEGAPSKEGGFSKKALEKRAALLEGELSMWKRAYDTLAVRLNELEQVERDLIYEQARKGEIENAAVERELAMYRRNYPELVTRVNACETWRGVVEPEFAALRAKHAKCVDTAGELAGFKERVKALEIELLRIPALVKAGRQELAKDMEATFAEERKTLLRRAESDRSRMREDHQRTKEELARMRDSDEMNKLRAAALEKEAENEKRTVRRLERTVASQTTQLDAYKASVAEATDAMMACDALKRDAEINRGIMARNETKHAKLLELYREAMDSKKAKDAEIQRLRDAMDELKIAFSQTEIGKENAKLREMATDITFRFDQTVRSNAILKARLAELEGKLQPVVDRDAQLAAIKKAAARGKLPRIDKDKE